MNARRKILAAVLAGAAAALLGLGVILLMDEPVVSVQDQQPVVTRQPDLEGTPPVTEGPTQAVGGLPVGKWVVTAEREKYEDGELTLLIPKLNVERTIWSGTGADTLEKGVGLYVYAQLPGEGNRNVSLAGHRNGLKNGKITDQAPFYYIDQLTEGDYLYLRDSGSIYRYVYEWTQVVEPDDWSPIATAGYSCLTITSCEPIGVSDHRIVVRAVLDGIFEQTDPYNFLTSEEEP